MAEQPHHPPKEDIDVHKIVTDRSKEREKEDKEFVPVIVKRTDESRRHPEDTLERAFKDGHEQLKRMSISLAFSSLAAGLIVGFSAMAAACAAQVVHENGLDYLMRPATALVYPLGFIMCVLSGTQLFTEHTATAVYPVLDKRAKPLQLARLWVIVILANLVGGAFSGHLLAFAEPVVAAHEGYILLAEHAAFQPFFPLLVSSLLAGWLMAQGAWLVLGSNTASGQIMSIYLVTFLIGFGRLHHSIAGWVEVYTGYLMGESLEVEDLVHFVTTALLGNLIGGSLFVAVLNYTQIRVTQGEEE